MLIMSREDPALAAGYFANYVGHTGVIAERARGMLRKAVAERNATAAATTQTARNLRRSLETSIVTVPPLA
jgi:hypothetical protein